MLATAARFATTLGAASPAFLNAPVSTGTTGAAVAALSNSGLGRRFFGAKPGPMPIADPKACKDDEVPSIFDQATGLERAEIDHPDIFKHNEVLRGAFGTKENPVKIQSAYDYRIVGCTGRAAPHDHDLIWLKVEKGKLSWCPECGQYFSLDPL